MGIVNEKNIKEILIRIENLLETLVKLNVGHVLEKEFVDDKMVKLYKLTGMENVRTIETNLDINKAKISEI